MTTRRFPIIATIITALAFCLLCALGTWQIQRLEWKTGLINQLNAEYAKDASKTNLTPIDLHGAFLFKRGFVHGLFAYDKQLLVGPRVYQEDMGFHLITPLQMKNGEWLLIDEGWVPADWIPHPRSPAQRSFIGLLRRPDTRNAFSPANHPEKNQWYMLDPKEIAAAKHLNKISPYILYVEGAPSPNQYPIPQASKPELSNNHLLYAIFWFSMAGALLIIYIFRFIKK